MLNCRSIQIVSKLLNLLMVLNLFFRIQSNPVLTKVNSEDIYNDLKALGGSCAVADVCKEHSNNGLLRFLNCHCDNSCGELDTCCLDSRFRTVEHQFPRNDLKCFDGYYGAFHVFMVDNCRSDWIDDGVTSHMCLSNGKDSDDPFLDMPMTSLKTGISYKNYYCSICNEDIVHEDQMVAWDILIKEKSYPGTTSALEYTSNNPRRMSTSKLATTSTWLETTNPVSSKTELDISYTSSTDQDTGDLLDDTNTRETIDLATSPTVSPIDLGTRLTMKSIATLMTSLTGQDKNNLGTIPAGRYTSSVMSIPTTRTLRRMSRAVTSGIDPVSHPTMPELKYNASLQTWMVRLQNSSTIPVTIKITLSASAWEFVKTCHPGLISECSMNWTEASTAQKCSSYMFLTRIERNGTTVRYRNPHCAICNHESLDNLDCIEEERHFGMGGSSDLYEAFFVGLFVLEDRKKKCRQDMVYDSLSKKCRVVKCPQNHIFKDKKCVKNDS